MKYVFVLILLTISFCSSAQKAAKLDTIVPAKGNENEQLQKIKDKKNELHTDSTGSEPKKGAKIDTTVLNKYGDLLNDDSIYNKKYHWSIPAIETIGINAFLWSLNRFALNADYSRVNERTWKHNIHSHMEWDADRFGINFVGHPYSGTMSFNAARSNGYNYWQSLPFAIGGSLMWEYFGENTLPSYNDIINTPVSGAFLGEIFYRVSSNILDDRSRGMQRILREVAAGIIDPVRGFNRILQGKTFRKSNKEVYQKEPLNVTLYGGTQTLDKNFSNLFKSENLNVILNLQLDYGNPFENRTRKPFDFFKYRVDFSFGVGRKILDNITGYGILTGKNIQADSGAKAMLIGLYQYYDYWDNMTYELGTIGFGAGIITKLPVDIYTKSNLYTSLHLAVIPLAGSSTRYGPDTSQFRDYNFGTGMEGKGEIAINYGKWTTATIVANYFWVHSYVGLKEDNFITIIKPRITVTLIKDLSIGFEEAFYYNNVHTTELPVAHLNRTETKIFLFLYLEDKQRRGHYN